MTSTAPTPLRVVGRGLAAGAVGTASMTAWQQLAGRLASPNSSGDEGRGEQNDSWESAPAPAQVAKRALEGVFGRHVSAEQIPLLTNVMHWAYGTAWGAVYALIQSSAPGRVLPRGLAFGSGVWAMSYVELVPMGLYKPPWEYSAKELGKDLSYHLVYGLGVATAYEAFART